MQKKAYMLILMCAVLLLYSGCSTTSGVFDPDKQITIISREDGSGTRGAFVDLMGIYNETADGHRTDLTVKTSDITQSTGVMLTNVAQNKYAVGYASIGSLNSNVKTLMIDGAAATAENIKNGTYKISRPFNITTKDSPTEAAADLISYILSDEGQNVVEDSGYISAVKSADTYASATASGKVTIAGSSSVAPVMEKLKEAYAKVNPNVHVEINQSDSSMGISNTVDGICDIGMASREVKESELGKGIVSTQIAIDGLAVIINNENPLDNLSREQVCGIYIGEITKWSDLG